MCFYRREKHACGCIRRTSFVQCPARQGTNVRCNPLETPPPSRVHWYCPEHLVKAGVRVVYTAAGGPWRPVGDEQGEEREKGEEGENRDEEGREGGV